MEYFVVADKIPKHWVTRKPHSGWNPDLNENGDRGIRHAFTGKDGQVSRVKPVGRTVYKYSDELMR